jgi:hypothetical protein
MSFYFTALCNFFKIDEKKTNALAWGTPDPNGHGGRTTPILYPWLDTNSSNQTQFKIKMRRTAGYA